MATLGTPSSWAAMAAARPRPPPPNPTPGDPPPRRSGPRPAELGKVGGTLLEKRARALLLLLLPELTVGQVSPELVALAEEIRELLHEGRLEDPEARRR